MKTNEVSGVVLQPAITAALTTTLAAVLAAPNRSR
jgi:hypothetical protein